MPFCTSIRSYPLQVFHDPGVPEVAVSEAQAMIISLLTSKYDLQIAEECNAAN